MAAGFSVAPENIEKLEQDLNEYAQENLPEELLSPKISVEGECSLQKVSEELVSDIEKLAPFGYGNPRPLFSHNGLKISKKKQVGEGKHLSLNFSEDLTGKKVKAIAFKKGEQFFDLKNGDKYQVVFSPQINEWNGKREMQIEVREIEKFFIEKQKKKELNFSGKKGTLYQWGNFNKGREKLLRDLSEKLQQKKVSGIYLVPTLHRLHQAYQIASNLDIKIETFTGFLTPNKKQEVRKKLRKDIPCLLLMSYPQFFKWINLWKSLPVIWAWESPYPDYSPASFYSFLCQHLNFPEFGYYSLEFLSPFWELPPYNHLEQGEKQSFRIKFDSSQDFDASFCVFSPWRRRKLQEKLKNKPVWGPLDTIEKKPDVICLDDLPPTGGEFLNFLDRGKFDKIFIRKGAVPRTPFSRKLGRKKLVEIYTQIAKNGGKLHFQELIKGGDNEKVLKKQGLKILMDLGLIRQEKDVRKNNFALNNSPAQNIDLFNSLSYNEFVNEKEAHLRWKKIVEGSFSDFINTLGGEGTWT